MLTKIASGTVFGEDDPCLHPLDKYVAEAGKQMRAWFFEGILSVLRILNIITDVLLKLPMSKMRKRSTAPMSS